MSDVVRSYEQPRLTPEYRRALQFHKENGHPKGYVGPCWGPTPTELERARQEAKHG